MEYRIKIVIFGTSGGAAEVIKNLLFDKAEIIAFSDNNEKKHNTFFEMPEGFEKVGIIPPERLMALDFDYIVIASTFMEITEQLLALGIEKNKIIPFYALKKEEWKRYRAFFTVDTIFINQLEKKMEAYISNLSLEVLKIKSPEKISEPTVLSCEETLEVLIREKRSICRFGDGELNIIFGNGNGFQKYDLLLAQRLREILIDKSDGCMIGILNNSAIVFDLDFNSLDNDALNLWMHRYREEYSKLLLTDKLYYDARITRHAKYVPYFKKIWYQRKVVVIEGDGTRMGIGNDLLDHISSIRRIICPSKNAFSQYNEIFHYCKSNILKDELVLIALGQTATVLAFDLSALGFQAIDVGHLDLLYEWKLQYNGEKKLVKGKYVNEIYGGDKVVNCTDESYIKQIHHTIR